MASFYAKFKGTVIPIKPTLGTGHMAYFLPYGGFLEQRFRELVQEGLRRGFNLKYTSWTYPGPKNTPHPDAIKAGRTILMERIRERLLTMKRTPTWTKSVRPEWLNPWLYP